jgi:hypothetical protein
MGGLFSILAIGLVGMGSSIAANGSPPPPPEMPDPSILLTIEAPGLHAKRISVRESEVRGLLGINVFYDIDAFIKAGLKKLGLKSEIDCQGVEPKRACRITRIGALSNSKSRRWSLYRDGRLEVHGINQVNWYGTKKISLAYEPILQTP